MVPVWHWRCGSHPKMACGRQEGCTTKLYVTLKQGARLDAWGFHIPCLGWEEAQGLQ